MQLGLSVEAVEGPEGLIEHLRVTLTVSSPAAVTGAAGAAAGAAGRPSRMGSPASTRLGTLAIGGLAAAGGNTTRIGGFAAGLAGRMASGATAAGGSAGPFGGIAGLAGLLASDAAAAGAGEQEARPRKARTNKRVSFAPALEAVRWFKKTDAAVQVRRRTVCIGEALYCLPSMHVLPTCASRVAI